MSGKKSISLHWVDVEELAREVCGLPEGADSIDIENAVDDQMGVSMDQFEAVVKALVPFTPPAQTLVTGSVCHGFMKNDTFLVKVEKKDLL